jgi:hypothetical protein
LSAGARQIITRARRARSHPVQQAGRRPRPESSAQMMTSISKDRRAAGANAGTCHTYSNPGAFKQRRGKGVFRAPLQAASLRPLSSNTAYHPPLPRHTILPFPLRPLPGAVPVAPASPAAPADPVAAADSLARPCLSLRRTADPPAVRPASRHCVRRVPAFRTAPPALERWPRRDMPRR